MRAFAEAWPDEKFVQEVLAQLPWDQFNGEHDQPAIGLILCREKNRLVVAYALRDLSKPIGRPKACSHQRRQHPVAVR